MTEINPGTRMMGAVPKTIALRGGLGTPPPAPVPADPHAERAAREGLTRAEAERRNHIDAYNAQHPMPSWNPPPVMMQPQANASVVNQIRIGGGYRPFNHGFHLVLTVLSCGMWAPVWLIAYLLHPMG